MHFSTSRKILIALAIGAALMPLFVSADTLSDLEAQVQSLLAQISQAQGQQSTTPAVSQSSQTTTPTGSSCPIIVGPLTLGSSGLYVAALQGFLAQQGLFTAQPTAFFGPITLSAVENWQSAHGIVSSGDASSTGFGVVGPRTAAAIAASCASAGLLYQGSTSSGPSSCPLAPPPTTECSAGWQAVTDSYGCTTSYKCSLPLPSTSGGGSCAVGYIVQNNQCVPATACPAIALVCPVGEQVQYNGCAQSCVANGTVQTYTTLSALPTYGSAPLGVVFTGVSGYISFGDGSGQAISSGAGTQTTHTYSSAGTYIATSGNASVTIVVSGTNSLPNISCVSGYTVSNGQCVPSSGTLSASPASGAAPLAVNFVGTTPLPYNNYIINFGDGQASGSLLSQSDPGVGGGEVTASHTYASSGNYTATLTSSANGAVLGTVAVSATQTVAGYCSVDCVAGYHPSGPSGSCTQQCIAN